MQLAHHINEDTVMVPNDSLGGFVYIAEVPKTGAKLCEGCELANTVHCSHVKCSAVQRKSGNEVIFVKRDK